MGTKERLQKIEEELAKISFSNIGHCVNTNLILDYITNLHKEIERLNNKLLLIKGIIRTPRELDKSLAYAMVKTQIENVLGSDKE